MSNLSEIVYVESTVTDKAPEKPNFGIPLIATFHTAWGDRVREYSQADELLADGFVAADPAYQMAQTLKSQRPAVKNFKVGRLALATYTHTVQVTPVNLIPGFTYFGTVAGVDFEFDVEAADTVADVCDDLVTAINAISGVTCTDNATYVTIAADDSETIVALSGFTEFLHVEDVTAVDGADLQADLTAINDEDEGWYGLCLDVNSADSIEAAGTWTEARRKLFFPMTADYGLLDSSEEDDIGTTTQALSLVRTLGIWHRNIGEWANIAWAAVNLAPAPGSYTAAFKALAGITVDSLRTGESSALKAKYWTRYTTTGGANITYEGRASSGRFGDITRGVDWLDTQIQYAIWGLLINNPKVPFTASGLSSIKGAVEVEINRAAKAGLVDGDSEIEVTVPLLSEVDPSDKINRLLTPVTYRCRLSGALHGVEVYGTVNV